MDPLTDYIVTYYPNLMTWQEKLAYRASIAEAKAANSESGTLQNMLRSRWGTSDPEILAYLKDGRESFLCNVRERILKEHAEEVFLNCCPNSAVLARTPT